GRDPRLDALVEGGVARPKHATGEDDIGIAAREVQASDHRASHRHDLVREPVDDLACLAATVSARAEYHRRELADLAIPDPARVEGLSHRRRRLQAPMARQVLLQGPTGATPATPR